MCKYVSVTICANKCVHCTLYNSQCNMCPYESVCTYNSQCLVCSEYEQYVQVRMFNKCMYSEETLDMVVYNLAADMRWRQYGVQICANMCP